MTGFILAEPSPLTLIDSDLWFRWLISSLGLFSPPSPIPPRVPGVEEAGRLFFRWFCEASFDRVPFCFKNVHACVSLGDKPSSPAGCSSGQRRGGRALDRSRRVAQMIGWRGSTSDTFSRAGIFCRGAEVCAGFKAFVFGRETRSRKKQAVWPGSGGWPWRSSREAWEISPAWETATMAASTRAMRPRSCCTSCQCGTLRPRFVEWTPLFPHSLCGTFAHELPVSRC